MSAAQRDDASSHDGRGGFFEVASVDGNAHASGSDKASVSEHGDAGRAAVVGIDDAPDSELGQEGNRHLCSDEDTTGDGSDDGSDDRPFDGPVNGLVYTPPSWRPPMRLPDETVLIRFRDKSTEPQNRRPALNPAGSGPDYGSYYPESGSGSDSDSESDSQKARRPRRWRSESMESVRRRGRPRSEYIDFVDRHHSREYILSDSRTASSSSWDHPVRSRERKSRTSRRYAASPRGRASTHGEYTGWTYPSRRNLPSPTTHIRTEAGYPGGTYPPRRYAASPRGRPRIYREYFGRTHPSWHFDSRRSLDSRERQSRHTEKRPHPYSFTPKPRITESYLQRGPGTNPIGAQETARHQSQRPAVGPPQAAPVTQFNLISRGPAPSRRSSPWANAWHQSKTTTEDGWDTELRVIASVEHYADESGDSTITLSQQGVASHASDIIGSAPLRWLHLRRETLSMQHFDDIAYHCPYISDCSKSVTAGLLDDVRSKMVSQSPNGTYFKAGSVIRFDGTYVHQPMKVDEPVIFFSVPHIVLKRAQRHSPHTDRDHVARTLLQFLYRYELGEERNLKQVVSTTWKSDEILHVSELWCLLIGNEVIITCGELSLSEILGPGINVRNGDPLCTVRLHDRVRSRHHILLIEPPIAYLDFRRRVMSTIMATHLIDIVDSDEGQVTAQRWLQLMEMDDLKELSFSIVNSERRYTWFEGNATHQAYTPAMGQRDIPVPHAAAPSVESLKIPGPGNIDSNGEESVPGELRTGSDNESLSKWLEDDEIVAEPVLVSNPLDEEDKAGVGATTRVPLAGGRYEESPSSNRSAKSRYGDGQLIRYIPPTLSHQPKDTTHSVSEGPIPPPADAALRGLRLERYKRLVSTGYVVNNWTSINDGADAYEIESSSSEREDDHSPTHRESVAASYPSIRSGVSRCSEQGPNLPQAAAIPVPGPPQRLESWSRLDDPRQGRGVHFNVGKVEASGSSSSSSSNSSGDGQIRNKSAMETHNLSVASAPFFTWHISPMKYKAMDKAHALRKLLHQIGNSMSRNSNTTTMYKLGFECTLQSLSKRHPFFDKMMAGEEEFDIFGSGLTIPSDTTKRASSSESEVQAGGTNKGSTASIPGQPSRRQVSKEHAEEEPSSSGSHTRTTNAHTVNGTEDVPGGIPKLWLASDEEVLEVLRGLCRQCASTIRQFIPADMEFNCMQTTVMKKYWGAVDRIIRHLKLLAQALKLRPYPKTSCYIRDFTGLKPSVDKSPVSFADCIPCSQAHQYGLLRDALHHLHTVHMHSHGHPKRHRLLDDPCLAWIGGNFAPDSEIPNDTLSDTLAIVRGLIYRLRWLQDRCFELRMSVVVQPLAGGDGSLRNIKSLPALPSHVVHAFEETVSMLLHDAYCLSLVTQSGNKAQKIINSTGIKSRERFDSAIKLLDRAERGLTTSSAAGNPRGIDLGPVGPHYLMVAVLGNLQCQPLSAPVDQPDVHDVDLYREYSAKLQFQVNERPQRRLFKDIRGLEEELNAGLLLIRSQQMVYDKFQQVLNPHSYRITSAKRGAMYRLETEYIEKLREELLEKGHQFQALLDKCKDLREDVRQSIEILEEGHGKAIRVFTIVTLFFLPLTFVSGFMGMNTADIRDTKRSQSIFWTVALPVTTAVLAIAFIYGYHGDDIGQFIDKTVEAWGERSRRRRLGLPSSRYEKKRPWHTNSDDTTTTYTEAGTASNMSRFGTKPRPAWLADMIEGTRLRRKKPKAGINRRKTDDSLLGF